MAELAEAEAVRQSTGGRIGAALIAHVPLDARTWASGSTPACRDQPGLPGRSRYPVAARGARARSPGSAGLPRGLRALAERGLVFEAMLTPPQMRQAAGLFGQVPDLPVALEHVGSPHDRTDAGLRLWRDGLDAFAALPSTMVKLSAMQCLEPDWSDDSLAAILDPIVERFGPDRLCVGTDWPVHDETCPGPEALTRFNRLTATWPEPDQRAVFETTARVFYKIP
jgi:predicted TIM-barrel fold metal-dependent hydrolase